MPDVTKLRSTPSMERLWATAEREEEARLAKEVEADNLAKLEQREVDTIQIQKQRQAELDERRRLLEIETIKSDNNKKAKRDEITCLSTLKHYCVQLMGFITIIIILILASKLIYSLYIQYMMVHQRLSIILTGNPGTNHDNSESYLINEHLMDRNLFEITDSLCENTYHGWLYGQRVILATTGVGHDRAAVCLTSLLGTYGDLTDEVLFLGTGRFSPMLGGVVNSDDCSKGWEGDEQLTMMGDVCISQTITNWEDQECMFPDKVDSACFSADCTRNLNHASMFGRVETGFYTSTTLANEVMSSMEDISLPEQDPLLWKYSQQYWHAMSQGTDVSLTPRTTPILFDHHMCGEASSDLGWQGAAFDELARKYVAEEIRLGDSSEDVSGKDVVAVSASEGIGWMSALDYYQRKGNGKNIASVNIRGAANHVHPPLIRHVREGKDGEESVIWSNDIGWASQDEIAEYAEKSYEYAVNTTSLVVLRLFEKRHIHLDSQKLPFFLRR